MTAHRKLWWLLGTSLFAAFFILGFWGREVYRQAPPIPERVVTRGGQTVFTRDDILTGQQVWQSTGGQQLGPIWDTARIRRLTGRRTGCIAKRPRSSTSGPHGNSCGRLPRSSPSSKDVCTCACGR